MYQTVLEGVRVVDFSWMVAGPFCTQLLGLMGAEVLKVESATRPQYKTRNGWFLVLNTAKQSCTINLATDRGKALVKRLIATSDVVVENFSAGVMDRLGLGYDALKAIKRDLIYVSSSGVGRTGTGRDYPAYGALLHGWSGWTSLFGEPNFRMEGMGISPSWIDPLTGSWEALLIQAALLRRATTGDGTYLDTSMLECGIAMMGDVFLGAAVTGSLPAAGQSSGYAHAVPHGVYPCQEEDAWIAISVEDQTQWEGLCKVLGDPAWCQEEAFATLAGRQAHRAQIDRRLADWTAPLPRQALFHRLQAAGVPAGPCYDLPQVMADAHLEARGLFRRLPQREGRTLTTPGLPWRDESHWRGVLSEAPALGEHNAHVFCELLGMPAEEYESLRRDGILD